MSVRKEKYRLQAYCALFATVMLLGTLGSMAAEGLSFADAAYFTLVTVATVGYGDIAPHTGAGKLLALVIIVGGTGTFLGVIASATEVFLNRRDRELRLAKLQMVIGLFFSEAGNALLGHCAAADPAIAEIRPELLVRPEWSEAEFRRARTSVGARPPQVDPQRADLEGVRSLLNGQSNLLVRLLENPYLLEHESFTDLLLAVMHLKEELLHRGAFTALPESDLQHLRGDLQRVYGLLLAAWVDYLRHLQGNYPFLFSLALRTNPYDPEASVIVC